MPASVAGWLDLAADLIGMGAIDFISKPFSPKGRTLAFVIERTLQKYQIAQEFRPLQSVATFTGGEMVFYRDRIELCGVKIFGSKTIASREMLKILAGTKSDGTYKCFGGDQIAAKMKTENGIGTITGCAQTIRNQTARLLKKHLNIEIGDNDVLEIRIRAID